MKTTAVTAAIALLVLATACATGSRNARAPTDRNMLTREQLLEHRFSTAYDAVSALRSNWLNTRGVDSFSTPTQVLVYFDNTRLGGIETLRGIAIRTISYIQHYDGLAATERWGLDHGAGVILVSTHPITLSRPR